MEVLVLLGVEVVTVPPHYPSIEAVDVNKLQNTTLRFGEHVSGGQFYRFSRFVHQESDIIDGESVFESVDDVTVPGFGKVDKMTVTLRFVSLPNDFARKFSEACH